MVELLFIVWSCIFLCTFLFILLKFCVKEGPLSSLNLYLLINFLGFIVFVLCFMGYYNHLADYMLYRYNFDRFVLLFTFILYTISFVLVSLFLNLLKYKPINPILTYELKKNIQGKFDFYSILVGIILVILILIFYGNPLFFDIKSLMNFRYEMSHGYIVALLIFVFPIYSYILLSLKRNIRLFFVLFMVFSLFLFLYNARGPFIFSTFFALFFLNISVLKMLIKLNKLVFPKAALYIIFLIPTIIFFYWWYSVNFRGQEGNPILLILKRADNFVASYLVMENNLIGFRFNYLFYPFLYVIPRSIYTQKPFPPNGDLTTFIFGTSLIKEHSEDNVWSVSFGLVGESLFVSSGLLIPLQSFLIALSLKIFSNIVQRKSYKGKLSYLEFALLYYLYIYPLSVVMNGILNPQSGKILLILYVLSIYKFVIKGLKSKK